MQFIVLGIVALIIVGAGAFYLGKQVTAPKLQSQTSQATLFPTPTLDGTANWKTYSNDNYGYSLRYPDDFFIEAERACNRLSGTDDNIRLFKNHGGQYQCSKGDEQEYFSVSATAAYQDQSPKNDPCVAVTREPVTIGGLLASRITIISNTKTKECAAKDKEREGRTKAVHTIVETDKITFDFGYTVIVGDIPEDTLNKILSTVSFLK